MITSPSTPSASRDQHAWSLLPLGFEIGSVIAIPAVLFGFGGAFLDKEFELSPVFAMLGLILAFSLSAFIVLRRVRSIAKTL